MHPHPPKMWKYEKVAICGSYPCLDSFPKNIPQVRLLGGTLIKFEREAGSFFDKLYQPCGHSLTLPCVCITYPCNVHSLHTTCVPTSFITTIVPDTQLTK